ncbi:MAG: tetratricopeptide repeat protein, partial [Spirochaetales bacterium]|nr:tetratricopeptide repeat protein [Spirochaetales bacterium]
MKKVLVRIIIALFLAFLSLNAVFSGETDKYKMSLQLYNDGFIDVAGKSFAEFLADYPTSMYRQRATYYLALTEIQAEDYPNAVKHLSAVVGDTKFEFYNDVLHYLTLGCFSIGQYADSEKYLALALQRNVVTEQSDLEEYEKLLYISIINNINLKKYQKALAKADDYFRHSHFTVYRYDIEKYLLNYYINGQDYENAAEMCRMIFEEPKLTVTDKILVEYDYIRSIYELRKYDEAIAIFQNNITYYNESLYLLISEAYGKNGDNQMMIKYLNDVYARSGDKDILVRIASLAVADGDYDKAISFLESYTHKDNAMMQMLGDMYYRKNNFAKAFEWFNKVGAAGLTDENFQLYFNCVVSLNRTDLIPTFYMSLDRLKNVSAEARNHILYKMAETFYNSGDMSKAEKVMAMWLSEFVGDTHYDKVLFMQAMTLKKNKKYDRAIVELSKLQKFKKNEEDEIFRESFAEKGELYFL